MSTDCAAIELMQQLVILPLIIIKNTHREGKRPFVSWTVKQRTCAQSRDRATAAHQGNSHVVHDSLLTYASLFMYNQPIDRIYLKRVGHMGRKDGSNIRRKPCLDGVTHCNRRFSKGWKQKVKLDRWRLSSTVWASHSGDFQMPGRISIKVYVCPSVGPLIRQSVSPSLRYAQSGEII